MFKDILLSVDLEHESSWEKALPRAVELARTFGCRLHVATVIPTFGMSIVGQFFPDNFESDVLKRANERLHEFVSAHIPEGVTVQHIVRHGTVYEEILAAARETKADLIVMGSHRPELSDYLLGPNAARVVRHSPASVLVVRG